LFDGDGAVVEADAVTVGLGGVALAEEVGALVFGEAGALVADFDPDATGGGGAGADGDDAADLGEVFDGLDGVGEEVDEDLLEFGAVEAGGEGWAR
jgi:hypothetical protein